MKAIVYRSTGGPEVMELVDRPIPEPGPGQVRVRVRMSGVNPTDWKARRGSRGHTDGVEQVPNQDGAGVVDAVGEGVDAAWAGRRVWIWEAAWQRADGTAQEYVVLPLRQVVPLPDHASFELGASLGIPALTAHRCLTIAEGGPEQLRPGALAGRTGLGAGGAGAVGNAAIQLARWAGATVITTVSSAEKEALARTAGAHHVVNYRAGDTAAAIRAVAPDGVDVVVEVAPGPNAELDVAVLAPNGTLAVYANDGGDTLTLPVLPLMFGNVRWQAVMIYTVPTAAKDHAVAGVSAAVADGALQVGEQAGLPLHHFPVERVADAHAAVEQGAVGKVLIELT
jgi:NADPH2:quinone reductase